MKERVSDGGREAGREEGKEGGKERRRRKGGCKLVSE